MITAPSSTGAQLRGPWPCQAVEDQPCRGTAAVKSAGDGQGEPGLVGPWQPGWKEAPLPCWASQGVGARPATEGKASRSFRALTTWTQLKMPLGLMQVEHSHTCSPQQTKPDILPTCTKKMVKLICLVFFKSKPLVLISVLIDNLFPKPWSSKTCP